MNARSLSTASRLIRPSSRIAPIRAPIQRRFASSGHQQQPSPLSEFYSSFTRPVAKVLLMAMFTYQLVYWGWVKLEQDEIMAEREGEIAKLEAEVQRLTPKSSA